MLVGLATWAIVGHSERRRDQGEDDVQIGRKILRCIEFGLRPILCVGEQLAEREAGRAESTVRGQLEATIAEVERASARALPDDLVIAYEPVWAIGTGLTARGSDAAAMAQHDPARRWPRPASDAAMRCPSCTAAASPRPRSTSSWPSPTSTARSSAAPA